MTRILGLPFFAVLILSSFAGSHPPGQSFLRSSKSNRSIHSYPFIKEEKNQINALDPEALRSFHAALDALASGQKQKVNVIHIGDSHVQADFFSGHLRELFQADSLFGNGGRGLVFPYTAVRTNGPTNVRVTHTGGWEGCRNISKDRACDWGLAGITATTQNANATLEINPNTTSTLPYPITRVKLFFDTQDATNYQVVIGNEEAVPDVKMDNGYVEFSFRQAVQTLKIGFRKQQEGQNHFTLQGITLENDQRGIVYHAAGVNGADVPAVIKMPSLEKNLTVLEPDLVIISLGTNDAFTHLDEKAFKRNYGELIQRIRRAAPATSILLTTPGDNLRGWRYENADNARAVQLINELAQETGTAVWDFYEVMGGAQSIRQWHAHRLAAADHVHLTQYGYMIQAELLYDALMRVYTARSQRLVGPPAMNGQ